MKDTFISQDGYDLCVICRQKTPYPSHTHIDFRIGYIEGVGQTCTLPSCRTITVPYKEPTEHEIIRIEPEYISESSSTPCNTSHKKSRVKKWIKLIKNRILNTNGVEEPPK